MERLCERPGCSDPASVAYGMRPEDLVFWLDVLRDARSSEHGVLCRRHADSMIVPRGWTLDDLRDPDLHLFRPPTDDTGSLPRRRSRRTAPAAGHEQLALGVDAEPSAGPPAEVDPEPAAVARDEATDAPGDRDVPDPLGDGGSDGADDGVAGQADDGADDDAAPPWMPVFDTDDDLDGLLAASSPLLSRAFRGQRPS